MMKRMIAGSLLGAMVLGGGAWAGAGPAARELPAEPHGPSVTVVGTGELAVRPDMAEVTVGVVTEAPTAAAALEANNRAMTQLFRTLSSQGIAERDIQTTTFDVSPRHAPTRGEERPRIIGYQVTNQVLVKVRQIPRLGGLLDVLVQSGANQVHGVSFSVADPEAALDRARSMAIADARRKAELYARTAGARVGTLLVIHDELAVRPIFSPALRSVEAADVPIAPGEQELQARVIVSWQLEVGTRERQSTSGRVEPQRPAPAQRPVLEEPAERPAAPPREPEERRVDPID